MGIDNLGGTETRALDNIGAELLQILAIVGSGLSIIFLIALGIKYIMGSVEQRAEYKKTMLPYLIGAIFVFGASMIAGLVYNTFNFN